MAKKTGSAGKNAVGRPPKFAGERTRGSLTVRLRDRVRDELQEAADKAGRSLSEEMEYRMELSLSRRDYLVEQWGHDVFNIANSMAKSLAFIEQHLTGKLWVEDERTFTLFGKSVQELIRNYRDIVLANGREVPSGRFDDKSDAEIAQMVAASSGISPPYPRTLSPQAEQAEREDNLRNYRKRLGRPHASGASGENKVGGSEQ